LFSPTIAGAVLGRLAAISAGAVEAKPLAPRVLIELRGTGVQATRSVYRVAVDLAPQQDKDAGRNGEYRHDQR
jgi:hypothetical protein